MVGIWYLEVWILYGWKDLVRILNGIRIAIWNPDKMSGFWLSGILMVRTIAIDKWTIWNPILKKNFQRGVKNQKHTQDPKNKVLSVQLASMSDPIGSNCLQTRLIQTISSLHWSIWV